MRVAILGADGYLGWPTAMHLADIGHKVYAVDCYIKREWEVRVGISPLVTPPRMDKRVDSWNNLHPDKPIQGLIIDIARERKCVYHLFDVWKPDVVIHYAEQPSAPYSMIGAKQCIETQQNNINGTLNVVMAALHYNEDCHIIKLGTMGEYGTPNIDIEEGWLDIEHNDRKDRVLYPKRPGSWYHLSKVHDSHNLEFASRTFGLQVTDLNQGVVYGTLGHLDPDLITSFHYDAIFGTVLNRFIAQAAVKEPLTVYGKGGQTRGFLNIEDTLKCVTLALDNPPGKGAFRVMNQFTEQFSVQELAEKVQSVTGCDIVHIPNPRVEKESHYYNAKHTSLPDLGLTPIPLSDNTLQDMFQYVYRRRLHIDKNKLKPDVKWDAR
jgi:UDP-sulfoquinovose synthase|tara:strand:+ start:4352 stop:5488 length:1137 start_codon:yes stop_codon:yes gene_type:complete